MPTPDPCPSCGHPALLHDDEGFSERGDDGMLSVVCEHPWGGLEPGAHITAEDVASLTGMDGVGNDEERRQITLAASEAQALDRRRGRRFATWLAIITMVMAAAVGRIEFVAVQIQRENVARQVDGCYRSNEFRIAYADDLLRRATPLDLAAAQALPEYQALPADVRPIVDLFLTTIAADRDDAAEVRRRFLQQFPIVDCAALRRSLS